MELRMLHPREPSPTTWIRPYLSRCWLVTNDVITSPVANERREMNGLVWLLEIVGLVSPATPTDLGRPEGGVGRAKSGNVAAPRGGPFWYATVIRRKLRHDHGKANERPRIGGGTRGGVARPARRALHRQVGGGSLLWKRLTAAAVGVGLGAGEGPARLLPPSFHPVCAPFSEFSSRICPSSAPSSAGSSLAPASSGSGPRLGRDNQRLTSVSFSPFMEIPCVCLCVRPCVSVCVCVCVCVCVGVSVWCPLSHQHRVEAGPVELSDISIISPRHRLHANEST